MVETDVKSTLNETNFKIDKRDHTLKFSGTILNTRITRSMHDFSSSGGAKIESGR